MKSIDTNRILFVYNRHEYECGIEANIFDFTKEDLDKAEKSDDGLVGTQNGCDFYLSMQVLANQS